MKFKERLNKLYKEVGNKLELNNFISKYKNVYTVGDCKQAAEKVAERVDGFKVLRITGPTVIRAKTHFVAVNGNVLVDLTFKAYYDRMKQVKADTTKWMDANKNKVIFSKSDYLGNIKE